MRAQGPPLTLSCLSLLPCRHVGLATPDHTPAGRGWMQSEIYFDGADEDAGGATGGGAEAADGGETAAAGWRFASGPGGGSFGDVTAGGCAAGVEAAAGAGEASAAATESPADTVVTRAACSSTARLAAARFEESAPPAPPPALPPVSPAAAFDIVAAFDSFRAAIPLGLPAAPPFAAGGTGDPAGAVAAPDVSETDEDEER